MTFKQWWLENTNPFVISCFLLFFFVFSLAFYIGVRNGNHEHLLRMQCLKFETRQYIGGNCVFVGKHTRLDSQ